MGIKGFEPKHVVLDEINLHEISLVAANPIPHTGIVSIDGELTEFGRKVSRVEPDRLTAEQRRIIRNRARQRATMRLGQMFPAHLQRLIREETERAEAEGARDGYGRLRPGRRMKVIRGDQG
jgi:hypothetical protein